MPIANESEPLAATEPLGSTPSAHATHGALIIGIVLAGMVLRVAVFGMQGSLHMDEAAVARNILERSWLGLTEPLSYYQASSLLHLWATKASVVMLGRGEWQLRLPALLAGLVSMGLFAILARRLLRPRAAALAAGLFALLPAAIYYSSFNKAYSFDVATTIALLLVALAWRENPTRRRGIILAVAGILASWVSFTSPMVLGGIGIALGIEHAWQRQWRHLLALAGCSALWLASFAAVWVMMAGSSADDPILQHHWKNAFIPLIPRSGRDIGVIVYHFFHLFESPFVTPFSHARANLTPFVAGLLAALCLMGASELWRRQRTVLLMLVLPAVLSLIASSMHRYPFRARFLLFLAPAVVVMGTLGMQMLLRWSMHKRNRIAAWAAPATVLLIALANTALLFVPQTPLPQMRQMLRNLASQAQPGDTVVVHDQSILCFEFYQDFFDDCRLNGVTVITGAPSTDLTGRIRDAEAAYGRARVWYVFESEWTFYADLFPDLGIWNALTQRDGAPELSRLEAGNTTAALFDYSHKTPATTPPDQGNRE